MNERNDSTAVFTRRVDCLFAEALLGREGAEALARELADAGEVAAQYQGERLRQLIEARHKAERLRGAA